MGNRRDKKRAPRISSNPESVTPWWNSRNAFIPKPKVDSRGESEFFSEFSTESLFTNPTSASDALDPYEVLGLFPGASIEQVKKAHRAMVKKYHPDRFAMGSEVERMQAEHKMVQVNGAYAELLARFEE